MSDKQLMTEIQELNLNYLMLAKNMITVDTEAAMFRLGISYELAQMLGGLSMSQMVKMSNTPNLICQFRFDDSQILGLMTDHSGQHELSHMRAPIHLSAQIPAGIRN